MKFKIVNDGHGSVELHGRFDASQAPDAKKVLWELNSPTRVDMGSLEYISSAGIGVLVEAVRRLKDKGHEMRFTNLTPSVRNVLTLTGLIHVLTIE